LPRLESIKRITRKSLNELKAEASAEFRGSNPGCVRCPYCHMRMSKQPIKLPVLALQMDVCCACSIVWFDGGELALAQLGYEATPGFADAQEMKRRMAELQASPDRKAAFEKNLAKLPEPRGLVEEAVDKIVGEALEVILRGFVFR
jgi:Zn-finger nucleic acid-binding protein